MQLITPKPYYVVNMHSLGEENSEEIFEWAYGMDLYLLDGDGLAPLSPLEILTASESSDAWQTRAWDQLAGLDKESVRCGDRDFYIQISQ